ncbi:hypothetical protein EDD17DRAFT_1629681 [Pisolithus thermaeus]|nr:hypothetical protein EV401DRAFT_1971675 [Pisolithus croceorrhizus]KAI6156076.1 hypothetical protein EDD17DRAFT_1629681 [Pisolithus thermaeus]
MIPRCRAMTKTVYTNSSIPVITSPLVAPSVFLMPSRVNPVLFHVFSWLIVEMGSLSTTFPSIKAVDKKSRRRVLTVNPDRNSRHVRFLGQYVGSELKECNNDRDTPLKRSHDVHA